MENFWLKRKDMIPVNIWLGSSITGGKEELLTTVKVNKEQDGINLPDVVSAISEELDEMLWNYRIGKTFKAKYVQADKIIE